jgi:hypothetical protein
MKPARLRGALAHAFADENVDTADPSRRERNAPS